MLRTLQIAPGFGGRCRHTGATRHPAHATTRWLRQATAALRTINEAWRDCVAARDRYGQLTSRGVPHEIAVREAMGFGPAPTQETHKSTSSLGCAGRA